MGNLILIGNILAIIGFPFLVGIILKIRKMDRESKERLEELRKVYSPNNTEVSSHQNNKPKPKGLNS